MFLLKKYKKTDASTIAKERLKLVLVYDRAECSPQTMEMMRADLIKTVSKYMDIKGLNLTTEISTVRDENDELVPTLSVNIPVDKIKNSNTV